MGKLGMVLRLSSWSYKISASRLEVACLRACLELKWCRQTTTVTFFQNKITGLLIPDGKHCRGACFGVSELVNVLFISWCSLLYHKLMQLMHWPIWNAYLPQVLGRAGKTLKVVQICKMKWSQLKIMLATSKRTVLDRGNWSNLIFIAWIDFRGGKERERM